MSVYPTKVLSQRQHGKRPCESLLAIADSLEGDGRTGVRGCECAASRSRCTDSDNILNRGCVGVLARRTGIGPRIGEWESGKTQRVILIVSIQESRPYKSVVASRPKSSGKERIHPLGTSTANSFPGVNINSTLMSLP